MRLPLSAGQVARVNIHKNPKLNKKYRIPETKHLSTDSDSSTDTTGGCTNNTQKPKFFEKLKRVIQNTKTQKCIGICQN